MIIGIMEESYPRELAKLANASVGSISRYLDRLEAEGITVSRYIGSERRTSLNPRFVGYNELKSLIKRLELAEPELRESIDAVRKRPRRRGKEI